MGICAFHLDFVPFTCWRYPSMSNSTCMAYTKPQKCAKILKQTLAKWSCPRPHVEVGSEPTIQPEQGFRWLLLFLQEKHPEARNIEPGKVWRLWFSYLQLQNVPTIWIYLVKYGEIDLNERIPAWLLFEHLKQPANNAKQPPVHWAPPCASKELLQGRVVAGSVWSKRIGWKSGLIGIFSCFKKILKNLRPFGWLYITLSKDAKFGSWHGEWQMPAPAKW